VATSAAQAFAASQVRCDAGPARFDRFARVQRCVPCGETGRTGPEAISISIVAGVAAQQCGAGSKFPRKMSPWGFTRSGVPAHLSELR